jgi:hypothetical protein
VVVVAGEGAQECLGAFAPGWVAGQVPEAGADFGQQAVGGRRGVVVRGARAGEWHVGRVGGAGVEAALPVREEFYRCVGEPDCFGQVARSAGGLV